MDSSTPDQNHHDPLEYTLVSTPELFQEALETIHPASRLALDMEADSLYHYFEKVCLVQISVREETYIIDPLAQRDLQALAPIMSDPSVEKVFHAASYDIFCLHRDFGFTFRNVFDTHIAAQLLGYEQLGLSALMEKLLGVNHSKRRQRDDWSRRPLEVEQLEYAAMDTRHLLELRDILEEQLREKDRLSWAREEFTVIAESGTQEKEFDPEGFRRIKGSRELKPGELAALRELYLLRDRYARELDVPPFKVINNSILIDLARKPPKGVRELFKRPGVSYRVARKFSGEIFYTIQKARTQREVPPPPPPRNSWKPMSQEAKGLLARLKQWRRKKADELELPVGVVFPGNLLETIASAPPGNRSDLEQVEGMKHWRAREFGCDILEVVHSQIR